MLHKCQHRLPFPIQRKSHHQIFAATVGFSVCQFSPSHFLSVSDLTRQANCAEPAACQVQQTCTSWGRKVNLRWQTLTIALPAWSDPRHERWKREETISLQREIKTTCQPNFQTQTEENYRKVTPLHVLCRQFCHHVCLFSFFFFYIFYTRSHKPGVIWPKV